MNKYLYRTAFCVGLAVVGWVAAGYLRTQPLALGMTGLIAAFYLMGALELRRLHQATTTLDQALRDLTEPPAALHDWLQRLPDSLRQPVRLRIEGERVALPGPSLTPYLAGLLVLLGMLGTFLGMVVTLGGTSVALERATDLQTMRDSLAAPVKGLGLAFGTSVAGVAASAMLGLMSALCRRQREQAAQRLDAQLATTLQAFGRAHQRRQTQLLLPELAAQLQALMGQLDAQARLAHERQLASQERFQAQAEAAYRELAGSVDRSLRHSLDESARLVAAALQPAVATTMSGITRETAALHGHIAGTVQQQLDGLSRHVGEAFDGFSRGFEQRSASLLASVNGAQAALNERLAEAMTVQLGRVGGRLDEAVQRVSDTWQAALAEHRHGSAQLLQQTRQAQAEGDAQRLAAWTDALAATAASLEHSAGRISAQAEAQARSTIDQIGRLMHTAAEAPRAAAEVVAQLRDKLSDSMARDNAVLEERSRIMAVLNTLLDAVQHASHEQRAAVDALVASSATRLQQAGERMDAVAAQVAAGAVDVASLGEAFGAAVEGFAHGSDRLMAHLQRVDETLGKAIARSDEQLAYYVAQARELIDLSLASQKQVIEDLQRLAAERSTA